MSTPTPLQELTQALDGDDQARAATLGFTLAGQGALPVVELFGIAARLSAAGQGAQAIALYRLWLEHSASSLAYAVWFNLGVALLQDDDENGAEQAYRHSIALKPDFAQGYLNLGTLQERQRQPEVALATWREGIARLDAGRPDAAELEIQLLNNLGRLLEINHRLPEAEAALARSLARDPRQPKALTHWVHLRQKQCAWPVYAALPGIDLQQMVDATSALATLSASDDPAIQLAAARRYVAEKVTHTVAPLSDARGYRHHRLRVGYLSSDFCSHAVAILTAELYQLHDRALVEVYGFCWSNEDGSPLRARVVAGMDHLIRIAGIDDEQAAHTIRAHEIDILIDLHGLTLGTRPDILAYRPAPVQISWLGFPGSTGMDSIDYVLADDFVLPPELTPFFSERPLYLPRCFQINDRQRPIGAAPGRAACGLAPDAFVFCCFNNNHKFTPEVFASWMRILLRVPHGVLWLIADSAEVRANMSQAAATHGVAPVRLIFAARVPPADYLARFQVADLFLDTLPFNAGTTASDALWAGLPLLTCAGRSFAGRMAGSLLRAAGLPELITYSAQQYEDKAVQLAHAPALLTTLRQRLAERRLTCPLFDSPRFVRDLEALYRRVARGELVAADPDPRPARAPLPSKQDPLVSILLPLAAWSERFQASLDSALAQSYSHCEIVIVDTSADQMAERRLAPLLDGQARLRYHRQPGARRAEALRQCVLLSSGRYLNFLTDDCVFHPEKIARMVHFYVTYPHTGLVTSACQYSDAASRILPPNPLFPIDIVVTGQSIGDSMLKASRNLVGGWSAPLLRRADGEQALGRFLGRQYQALDDVASWLAILSQRDCVYLHQALLNARQPAPPVPAADDMTAMDSAVEWLQLLLDAHRKQAFLIGDDGFEELLAARLPAFASYVAAHRGALRAARYDLEPIHQVIRQGYQLLLQEPAPLALSA
ncbi:MAG: glycosyltransferase [Pseudomonadota bacterium]